MVCSPLLFGSSSGGRLQPSGLAVLVVGLLLGAALSGCGASTGDAGDVAGPRLSSESDGTSANPKVVTGGPLATFADESETVSQLKHISVVAEVSVPNITVRSAPEPDAEVVVELANPVATGGPLVFMATEAVVGEDGWIEVMLPVRPNGTTGWVQTDEVELKRNHYRVEIDVSDHLLWVYLDGEVVVETEVGIGTGDTPTPIGSFYLAELLEPIEQNGPYGDFAFGLSGFSETLTNFNGGEGVIGIHGTNDPDSLGTNVSHGCVRVANEVISQLAAELPLGTPVHIEQ